MSKILSIQAGRAFAAVSVVLCHTLHEAEKWPNASPKLVALSHYMPFGSGVEIFFVISGFVMYHISRGRREIPGYWQTFLENRVLRIVPVYWFYTLVMVGILLAIPSAFDTAHFDPWHLLRSLFFLPGPNEATGFPILSLGWTLNLEMYFYVLFAISLAAFGRHAVPVLSAVLVGLVVLHPWLARLGYPFGFWSLPIILNFVAGMGLGALRERGVAWSRPQGLACIAGSLLLFTLLPALGIERLGDYDKIALGVAATLFVAPLVFSPDIRDEGPLERGAVLVGDASYTLYLCHPFVLTAVFLVMARLPAVLLGQGWIYVAVSTLLAVIAAVVGYFLFERPVTALLRDSLFRPREAARKLRTGKP